MEESKFAYFVEIETRCLLNGATGRHNKGSGSIDATPTSAVARVRFLIYDTHLLWYNNWYKINVPPHLAKDALWIRVVSNNEGKSCLSFFTIASYLLHNDKTHKIFLCFYLLDFRFDNYWEEAQRN
jgi:hypothetical protein